MFFHIKISVLIKLGHDDVFKVVTFAGFSLFFFFFLNQIITFR